MVRTAGGASPPHRYALSRLSAFSAALAAALLLLPSPGPAGAADGEVELQKARRAAQALQDQLRERLESRMKEAGAPAALKVCAYQAQGVAKDLEQTQGVRVKRASLAPRNPANGPDDWERAVLEKYGRAHEKGFTMEEVFERVEGAKGSRGEWRYARPIVAQKGCLACHGPLAEIDPEVVRGLHDRYPEDRATGLRVGDLRGIVSVRFPEEGGGVG